MLAWECQQSPDRADRFLGWVSIVQDAPYLDQHICVAGHRLSVDGVERPGRRAGERAVFARSVFTGVLTEIGRSEHNARESLHSVEESCFRFLVKALTVSR
jgi:hypothetical protein